MQLRRPFGFVAFRRARNASVGTRRVPRTRFHARPEWIDRGRSRGTLGADEGEGTENDRTCILGRHWRRSRSTVRAAAAVHGRRRSPRTSPSSDNSWLNAPVTRRYRQSPHDFRRRLRRTPDLPQCASVALSCQGGNRRVRIYSNPSGAMVTIIAISAPSLPQKCN